MLLGSEPVNDFGLIPRYFRDIYDNRSKKPVRVIMHKRFKGCINIVVNIMNIGNIGEFRQKVELIIEK